MIITEALGLPVPKTVCVLVSFKAHRVQAEISSRSSSRLED